MALRSSVILASCLSLLIGCDQPASFEADSALRPAEAGQGEAVAKVLLLQGSVSIRAANGQTFEARPQVPLLRSDSVQVGSQSFVVLQLRNQLLNRIDSDQELRVADLASLDAPPASAPIEQQLTRLLTNQEREQPERIVGWHARMSAAQGVPAHSENEVEPSPELDEVTGPEATKRLASGAHSHKAMKQFGGEPAAQASAPAHEASRSPQPGSGAPTQVARPRPAPKPAPRSRASERDGRGLAKDLDDADLDTPADKSGADEAGPRLLSFERLGQAKKSKKSKARAQPPGFLEALVQRDEFAGCLEELARKQPDLQQVEIQIEIHSGKLTRLVLSRDAFTQACLTRRLFGKPVAGAGQDGVYKLTVRLR